MANSQVYIVIDDDQVSDLQLGGGVWGTAGPEANFFGGSCVRPRFSTDTHGAAGSISFTFSGTAFALYGNDAGPSTADFRVTIDGAGADRSSSPATTTQTSLRWYNSPVLTEGPHTVLVTEIVGIAFDYFLITPGPTTPLIGATLMVDDAHVGITYSGTGWEESREEFLESASVRAQSFQNGVHKTSAVGDSLTFTFTGTNMKLYGMLPHSGGTIILSYTIDSASTRTTNLTVAPRTFDSLHRVLVDTGSLDSSEHSVTVTLTESSMPLVVDYILYSPWFSNLAANPASVDISPAKSAFSTAPVESKPPIGAITGSVIGGLVVIVVALFLLWKFRQRNRPRQRYQMLGAGARNPSTRFSLLEESPSYDYEAPASATAFPPPLRVANDMDSTPTTNRSSTPVQSNTPVSALEMPMSVPSSSANGSPSASSPRMHDRESEKSIDVDRRQSIGARSPSSLGHTPIEEVELSYHREPSSRSKYAQILEANRKGLDELAAGIAPDYTTR